MRSGCERSNETSCSVSMLNPFIFCNSKPLLVNSIPVRLLIDISHQEAIEMLASFISEKGKVDSLGLKEMIARKMVKLISNKVRYIQSNLLMIFIIVNY